MNIRVLGPDPPAGPLQGGLGPAGAKSAKPLEVRVRKPLISFLPHFLVKARDQAHTDEKAACFLLAPCAGKPQHCEQGLLPPGHAAAPARLPLSRP